MTPSRMVATAVVLFVAFASAAEGARTLLQQEGVPSEIQPPAGNNLAFVWHGVGTQNYTSLNTTQYGNGQGWARLYKNGTESFIGFHYFNTNGAPVFTEVDSNYNQVGYVVTARAGGPTPVGRQPDDGGFGSIPFLLLRVSSSGGTLSDVTFVSRINPKGGVVPTGMFTLPGYTPNIGNALLAIPYQIDYLFFKSG